MLDDCRNRTFLYRAGILFLLSCLLLIFPAAAQVGDTVRIGQDTDTAAASDKQASSRLAEDTAPPVVRFIPDSVAGSWRKDEDFAYANDPAYWQRQDKVDSPGLLWRLLSSPGFRYFLWIFLGGVLLYAIMRIIADNNMRLFYRSPGKKGDPEQGEPPGLVEEDLDGQLQHFLQIGDHRQAVRYLYLKSLRLLNDRGLIRYQNHKTLTNREYLGQLGSDPRRGPFSDLTIAYEKVWYGEFPLTAGQFGRLHQYFEEFFKTVRS
jgi:hypothetical protein